jgi:undecaprenyl-diphosphatase
MMKNLFSLISAGDAWLFQRINQRCRCALLDAAMSKLTHLGGAFCTTFICIFLITSNIKNLRVPGVQALIALSASQIVVQVLKRKVGRQRPYLIFRNIQVRKPLFDCSFPSGHTTAGYALATMFALDFPFLSFPLLTLATLVGFSRTYLGFHYPLDVFMGAVVGGGTAFTVHHYMPLSFLF